MKKGNSIKKLILIIPMVLIVLTNASVAHSGRTDSRGGHKDNQNKSGLGSYHYHCGGYPAHLHPNGVCPYETGSSNETSTIVKQENTTKEVTDVKIIHGYATSLEIGEKLGLLISITPTDATNKTITWKSSNPEILSVNEKGEIDAISQGTAQITATSNNGKTSEVSITVKPKPILVEQILLSKTNITVTEGEEIEIIATVLPDNATNKTITWKSSDTNIVTVRNGKVKARKGGTVTITALSENNIETTCQITVKEKESNSIGAVGTIGGLGIIGVIGAIVKSKNKVK